MNSSTLRFWAVGLAFISTLSFGLSFKGANKIWQKAEDAERAPQAIDTLVVGNYNVENLFEKALVQEDNHLRDLFSILDAGTNPVKPLQKIKDMSRAILENKYDILVVEEVENIRTLELLNKNYLKNLYKPFLIEGNDPRGIDVGFFVKKDLPVYVEERTNKEEKWNDPVTGQMEDILFSRDLPELHVKMSGDDKPIFILLGTHFKSKIDRKGDPQSKILRKAQVERTADIFKRLESEFGSNTALFLAGDYNGEASWEPEFVALKSGVKMYDSFDQVTPEVSKSDRFTHLYFPSGKPFERSQLDSFMMSSVATKAVRTARPYRYKDIKGNVIPIPLTYKEKDKVYPSDHYPVVVEMDAKMLLK